MAMMSRSLPVWTSMVKRSQTRLPLTIWSRRSGAIRWSLHSAMHGTCSISPTPISCVPPNRVTLRPCASSGTICMKKAFCIREPMKAGTAFTKRPTTPNPTSRRTRRANTFAPIASALFRKRAGKRTGSSSFPISKTSCSNSTRRILISSARSRVRMKLFRS